MNKQLITENISAPLLLKIEFTTEGTQIFLSKEWTKVSKSSIEGRFQAVSALTLLNILVDNERLEKKIRNFAESFDIEKLEKNLVLWENEPSVH